MPDEWHSVKQLGVPPALRLRNPADDDGLGRASISITARPNAYLLGWALREGLVLATLDKPIIHLAGEQGSQVLLVLKDPST
jgi:hypothetical protein